MLKKLQRLVELLNWLKGAAKPVSKELTKAQRTTQMYNRRDLYLKLLDEFIALNPEDYKDLTADEKYEKAHENFLQMIKRMDFFKSRLHESKNNLDKAGIIKIIEREGIELPEGYEWVRGVTYNKMKGATSYEDMKLPIDSDSYWEYFSDPERSLIVGRSNWENTKK